MIGLERMSQMPDLHDADGGGEAKDIKLLI
jgi:hypothetical protein